MKTFLLSIVSLLISNSALAIAPEYVRVGAVTYGGTGCPTGTARAVVSPDRESFTMIFDQYTVEAGPGRSYSDSRKNCLINVYLDFPTGWTYGIFRMDYRGYIALDRGTWGQQLATYWFQGQLRQASFRTPVNGPLQTDYVYSDTLDLSSLV